MILLTKHTHFPSIPAKNNECKCNRWQWLFRAGIYFFPIYKMQKSPINFEIDLLSQLCAGVYILPFNIWRNIVLEALLCIDLCDRGYMSPSIHICIAKDKPCHFHSNIQIKLYDNFVTLRNLKSHHMFVLSKIWITYELFAINNHKQNNNQDVCQTLSGDMGTLWVYYNNCIKMSVMH